MTEETVQTETDAPDVWMKPPKLYGGALLIAVVLNLIIPVHPMGFWPAFFMGIFFVSGGAALMIWAIKTFIAHETNVPTDMPATTIVTKGPYSVTRNPIYIGLTLLYCGFSFMVNTGWAFLILIPLLWVIHRRVVLEEEDYLEAKFGQDYLDYKNKVKRWL